MRLIHAVCVVLFFTGALLAQQPSQSNSPASDKPTPAAKPDTHLSPAEAEELFKSVDDLMQFASQDSGLPIKTKVKREMGDRDQVVKYIQQKMEEDEDTKRFERTELVLKKFGLLPVDFELKPFLVKLLREQVAGFYDSKTKTMHLLDWLPAEAQRPVIAHELTHALQDQTVDLDTWVSKLTDSWKKAPDPVNAEIENDEDSTARSAVAEGQGTAVMIDYMLAPMNLSIEKAPALVDKMKEEMNKPEGEGMAVLASAPVLLRETLTFPYRDGLGFIAALLKDGGKQRAFAGTLKNPPHDTHQILHPEDYLAHKPTPVMHMPDLSSALGKNYEKYDVGSIGEFDLHVLFMQFNDDKSLKELTPKWDGGMYYTATKLTKKTAGAPKSPQDIALLYVSRWPTPDDARAFAVAYGQTVGKRYANAVSKDCDGARDCSTWNIAGNDPVIVQTIGNQVFVSENFDAKTADALRKLIVAQSSTTEKMARAISQGNLSMRVPRFFSSLAGAR